MSTNVKKPSTKNQLIKFDTSKKNLQCFMKKRSNSLTNETKPPLNKSTNKKRKNSNHFKSTVNSARPKFNSSVYCNPHKKTSQTSGLKEAQKVVSKKESNAQEFHTVNFITNIIKNAILEENQLKEGKEMSALFCKVKKDLQVKGAESSKESKGSKDSSSKDSASKETYSKESKDSPPNDELLKSFQIFREGTQGMCDKTLIMNQSGRKTPLYNTPLFKENQNSEYHNVFLSNTKEQYGPQSYEKGQFDIDFGKEVQWNNFSTQIGTDEASERSRRQSALDQYPSIKLEKYYEGNESANDKQPEEKPQIQNLQEQESEAEDDDFPCLTGKKPTNATHAIKSDKKPQYKVGQTVGPSKKYKEKEEHKMEISNTSSSGLYGQREAGFSRGQFQQHQLMRNRRSTPIGHNENQQYVIHLEKIYSGDQGSSTQQTQSSVSSLSSNFPTTSGGSNVVSNCYDLRTSIMIRNVPNKYTQDNLLEEINKNHRYKFNFLYLPLDSYNGCNVGYAFINFIDTKFITKFYQEFNNRKWSKFNSEKICELAYARIQGTQALMAHFQNSNVARDRHMRPYMIVNNEVKNGSSYESESHFEGEHE